LEPFPVLVAVEKGGRGEKRDCFNVLTADSAWLKTTASGKEPLIEMGVKKFSKEWGE